jgi:hypothetical protein
VVGVVVLLSSCGSPESENASSTRPPTTPLSAGSTIPDAAGLPEVSVSATNVEATPSPYLGSLHFDWPSNCRVAVSEFVDWDGQTMRLSYPVAIADDGDGLRIEWGTIDVIESMGKAATEPEAGQIAALFALPTLTVGSDGNAVAVSGADEIVQQMRDVGLVDGSIDETALIAEIEKTVLIKYWDTWVGRWVALGSVSALQVNGEATLTVGDSVLTYDLATESLVPETEGIARLRQTAFFDEDDLRALEGQTLVDDAGFEGDVDTGETTRFEIVTAPMSLRPTRITFDDRTYAAVDGELASRYEHREWTFDWSASTCDLD